MEGDCHYLEGNINARRRVEHIRDLLDQIGLEGRRIQMINVSSAMGAQFAWSAAEFTEEIKRIGPNPLREVQELKNEKQESNASHQPTPEA